MQLVGRVMKAVKLSETETRWIIEVKELNRLPNKSLFQSMTKVLLVVQGFYAQEMEGLNTLAFRRKIRWVFTKEVVGWRIIFQSLPLLLMQLMENATLRQMESLTPNARNLTQR